MNTSIFLLLAGCTFSLAMTTERPCEDAPGECTDRAICKDPLDAKAYCPRFCGFCTGPTPEPVCRDYDKGCSVLANTNYCELEIASHLCPKSCGYCSKPTTTTTPEPTTTTLGYTMIPDPACQDIDPNCITLLQRHFCGEEDLVQRLCRRSCNLCPLIEVPVTAPPKTESPAPGATTMKPTQGPTTAAVCQNRDPLCELPETEANCTTDELIPLLCPVTCGICSPPAVETTPAPAGNEDTTADSGVTDEGTDSPVTDSPVTGGPVTDSPLTDAVTDAVTDDGMTDGMTAGGMGTQGPTTTLKPVPSLEPFTPPASNCRDRDPQCNFLIQSFYCKTNDLVQRICPASCGLCGPTQAPPTGGTTTPAAGAPTLPGGQEVCEDIDPQCPTLLEFCQRTDTLVNRLCRKSCGFCGVDLAIPTPKPGPAGPLECHICIEPFCQLEVETVRTCSSEKPYCYSSIVNREDGTRGLSRGCAAKSECDEKYLQQTAGDARCQNYDINVFVNDQFSCFYCCSKDDCNIPVVPSADSLYNGQ